MMNLKSWMRVGGIIAVLLGTTPMLAVAQEYGSSQFDERNLIDVRNSGYHCHRQSYRNSRGYSYTRRYCHTQSHRGSNYYSRGHYYQRNNRNHRDGYQSR